MLLLACAIVFNQIHIALQKFLWVGHKHSRGFDGGQTSNLQNVWCIVLHHKPFGSAGNERLVNDDHMMRFSWALHVIYELGRRRKQWVDNGVCVSSWREGVVSLHLFVIETWRKAESAAEKKTLISTFIWISSLPKAAQKDPTNIHERWGWQLSVQELTSIKSLFYEQ